MIIFVLTTLLVAKIAARPGYNDYYSPARYDFKYGVDDPNTGDHKQQQEVRVGHVVRGSYSLAEPDGTYRIVEYGSAPHTGFNAVVRKIGQAQNPPSYQYHGANGLYGAGIGGVGAYAGLGVYAGVAGYGLGGGYNVGIGKLESHGGLGSLY